MKKKIKAMGDWQMEMKKLEAKKAELIKDLIHSYLKELNEKILKFVGQKFSICVYGNFEAAPSTTARTAHPNIQRFQHTYVGTIDLAKIENNNLSEKEKINFVFPSKKLFVLEVPDTEFLEDNDAKIYLQHTKRDFPSWSISDFLKDSMAKEVFQEFFQKEIFPGVNANIFIGDKEFENFVEDKNLCNEITLKALENIGFLKSEKSKQTAT